MPRKVHVFDSASGAKGYGPATQLVERLIDQAGQLTMEDVADIYRARAGHLLVHGSAAERRALAQAVRAAAVAGLADQYTRARHDAVTAWRHALPGPQGPWLLVGQAIANAAGGLVVSGVLDDKALPLLTGAWRQAMGNLTPVGPGVSNRQVAVRR